MTGALPDTGAVSSFITYVGPFCMAATLILGVWWRVEGKINGANERAHQNEKDLSEFKLKVAEEYASWETVRSIEARLTERMDTLSEQVMKMPDAVLDRIAMYLNLKPTK